MVLRYCCRFRPRFMVPSSPAFWAAVTLMRPSGPASHHRRGHSWVDGKGCDHADGTPAACLVAGAADRIALPVGARYDIVRCVTRDRLVDPAQCQTRHPDGGGYSAGPGRRWSLFLPLPVSLNPAAVPVIGHGYGYGQGHGDGHGEKGAAPPGRGFRRGSEEGGEVKRCVIVSLTWIYGGVGAFVYRKTAIFVTQR